MIINLKNKQRKFKLDTKKIKDIVAFVIKNEIEQSPWAESIIPDSDSIYFNINVINEKNMTKLHAEVFADSSPTDVISFGYLDSSSFISEEFEIGEIFVSIEQAAKVYKKYKTTADYEFILYIIHGILHIFGLDDDTPENQAIMRKRENFYMQLLTHTLPVIKTA